MSAPCLLETGCLALPPALRTKLVAAGFRLVQDLQGVGAVELAAELQVTPEEALAVVRAAGLGSGGAACLQGSVSARELLEHEKSAGKILTFCGELDAIMGGGVHCGQVTEFCGPPGIGKTQIGMQLAIDVQIPRVFHGLEGEALYIDTEGSFFPERAREVAEAFLKHLRKLAAAGNQPQKAAAVEGLSWEHVLQRIHYFRCLDLTEQLAVLANLDAFVAQHPAIKLVVLDSLAFHLRGETGDMAARARLLARLAQDLARTAEARGLAVVLMNHVTTRVTPTQTRIVPALGSSWAHAATSRVILYWKGGERWACLYKSPCLPPRATEFLVTREGVRGLRQAQRKRAREPAA